MEQAARRLTNTTPTKVANNETVESTGASDELQVPQSNAFFFARVGYHQSEYTEKLDNLLHKFDQSADFVSIPIQAQHDEQQFLPDLALHNDCWQTRINIEIEHEYVEYYHFGSARKFEFQLRHALYLTSPSILVYVPDSEGALLSVASTVNDRLSETASPANVIFQIPFIKRDTSAANSVESWPALGHGSPDKSNNLNNSQLSCQRSPTKWSTYSSTTQDSRSSEEPMTLDDLMTSPCKTKLENVESGLGLDRECSVDESSQNSIKSPPATHWSQWNQLRHLLNLDNRIGVALLLSEKLLDEDSEINRWVGEPVRMIIIPSQLFTMSKGQVHTLRLQPKSKKFIQMILNANSMRTNLVLRMQDNKDVIDSSHYLSYLNMFADNLKLQNQDPLRDWDDKIQPPLQPLSSNLDSSTYTIFELDPIKYIRYRDAIKLALEKIINDTTSKEKDREIVLMVLGAGRGPLVDSMLEAIKSIEFNPCNMQIYALDKNPSSVRSLRYKLQHKWKTSDRLKIDVINADMRAWQPGVKADLIATELLGSLSDNELSPECIDGAARFAKPRTISIPQDYSSHIAPICSQKLRCVLRDEKLKTRRLVYDQIYVSKLSNYFQISKPQRLFSFDHKNFDREYLVDRTNERYIKLTFWSDVDTVCHGFAGYFSANLFNNVTISTLSGNETEGMFSWFPAFIPIEKPITLSKGSRLDLHFWRKESNSRVWYEWAVTHPETTKIHGQNGNDTAMSKFI